MITRDNEARRQAAAQYASIAEMVRALRKASKRLDRENSSDAENAYEEARRVIEGDALSVQVRTGWHSPGANDGTQKPEEFEILLCTGGPAVRIIGKLSEYCEPKSARIEFQDWFTPWAEWASGRKAARQEIILEYCRVFWFGE
jgi:hypothetical protein